MQSREPWKSKTSFLKVISNHTNSFTTYNQITLNFVTFRLFFYHIIFDRSISISLFYFHLLCLISVRDSQTHQYFNGWKSGSMWVGFETILSESLSLFEFYCDIFHQKNQISRQCFNPIWILKSLINIYRKQWIDSELTSNRSFVWIVISLRLILPFLNV